MRFWSIIPPYYPKWVRYSFSAPFIWSKNGQNGEFSTILAPEIQNVIKCNKAYESVLKSRKSFNLFREKVIISFCTEKQNYYIFITFITFLAPYKNTKNPQPRPRLLS